MFVIEINEELLKRYLIYQYTSHFKVIIINVHCFFFVQRYSPEHRILKQA